MLIYELAIVGLWQEGRQVTKYNFLNSLATD